MPEQGVPRSAEPPRRGTQPRSAQVAGPGAVRVSLIVPAWNEAAVLPATLAALRHAVEELALAAEILVVDDASSDATAEIAAAAGSRVERVELRQIAAVRNAGARAARGALLVFVDADTIVPPATLRAAVAAMEAGAVGGGANVSLDEPAPWAIRLPLWVFMTTYRLLGYAAGCFVFCRREAFEAIGGFDERFYASEEIGLSKALRKRGRFVKVAPPVVTSGRKVRLYRPWPLFLDALRLLLRGPRAWQSREGLGIWYEGRREG